MTSSLDVHLSDDDLNTEIQLLAELMVLATEAASALDLGTIDEALGLGAQPAPVPGQRVSC